MKLRNLVKRYLLLQKQDNNDYSNDYTEQRRTWWRPAAVTRRSQLLTFISQIKINYAINASINKNNQSIIESITVSSELQGIVSHD